MIQELQAGRLNADDSASFDPATSLRVGLGLLADKASIHSLVDSWLSAGHSARLLVVFSDVALDLGAVNHANIAVRLERLTLQDSLASWSLRDANERPAKADQLQCKLNAEQLLKRLVDAGERCDWATQRRAVARERTLGVVQVARGEADAVALLRPLLTHAERPVRVCDLS